MGAEEAQRAGTTSYVATVAYCIAHRAAKFRSASRSQIRRVVTGPPTHSVGGRLVTVAGVCRRRL